MKKTTAATDRLEVRRGTIPKTARVPLFLVLLGGSVIGAFFGWFSLKRDDL